MTHELVESLLHYLRTPRRLHQNTPSYYNLLVIGVTISNLDLSQRRLISMASL